MHVITHKILLTLMYHFNFTLHKMEKIKSKDSTAWIGLLNRILFTAQGLLFLAIAVYSVTQICTGTKNDLDVVNVDDSVCNTAIATTLLAGIQLIIATLLLVWFKTYIDTIYKAVACYIMYPLMPVYGIACIVREFHKETDMYAFYTLCGISVVIILVQLISIITLKCRGTKEKAQEDEEEKLSK